MIEGQFNATGVSPEEQPTEVDLSVSGTFDGTVAEVSATGGQVFVNAQVRGFRLGCTAYTSGTNEYAYG